MKNKEDASDTDKPIPDLYVDRVRMTVSIFGVNFTFGLSQPHPESGDEAVPIPSERVVILRMSPEHAKVMCMMLRNQIKGFEKESGARINLPKEVMSNLGLSEEEW